MGDSEYVFLVNKEVDFANSQAEWREVRNSSKDTGKKKEESKRWQQPLQKQDVRSQAISLMVKYAMIEID